MAESAPVSSDADELIGGEREEEITFQYALFCGTLFDGDRLEFVVEVGGLPVESCIRESEPCVPTLFFSHVGKGKYDHAVTESL